MKNNQFGCLLVALATLLGGCSSGGNDAGGAATPMALQGVVHGGQAPISGSTVTLRAASEQGLSNATTVASATTDSNGNFNFSFTCPSPTAQMYLTSTGGNPGGGANSAIHLMSILGPCGGLHGSATINELTTVAAAYTANNFIGPSGCDDCNGGLPISIDNISGPAPGLPNAMGNAALLANSITGLDTPSLPTSADCSSSSPSANCLTVKKLNTAANALAACVNSAGPTSAQCTQLFDCAVVGAVFTSSTACTPPSGATLATNTLTAMLNIVRNPVKISVDGIDDTSSRDVVFSPAFSAHFTDYTLSLDLTSGGFNNPQNLAVDGAGNVWVTNGNGSSVIELSPHGLPLSGAGGFATGSGPQCIAIDASGDAWVTDYFDYSLTVLDPEGQPILGSPITGGGLGQATGIAVSPDGDVWVADANGNVSRFSATGVAVGSGYTVGNGNQISVAVDAAGYVFVVTQSANAIVESDPSGNYTTLSNVGLSAPVGAAIDPNGNLWIANYKGENLTKISLANEIKTGAASFGGGGLSNPTGVAIDASGNVWVANTGSAISEFNSTGTALSAAAGFVGAGLPAAVVQLTPAIDPSGNVWVANANNGVTVYFGAAAPTRTPLVAALTQGFVP